MSRPGETTGPPQWFMLHGLQSNAEGIKGLAVRPLDAKTLVETVVAYYLYCRAHGYSVERARADVEERSRETLRALSRGPLGPYLEDERVRSYGERLSRWSEDATGRTLDHFIDLHEHHGHPLRKAKRRTWKHVAKRCPAPVPSESRKGVA